MVISYTAQYPIVRNAQSAFTLFPDRPVQSNTISISLGSVIIIIINVVDFHKVYYQYFTGNTISTSRCTDWCVGEGVRTHVSMDVRALGISCANEKTRSQSIEYNTDM